MIGDLVVDPEQSKLVEDADNADDGPMDEQEAEGDEEEDYVLPIVDKGD